MTAESSTSASTRSGWASASRRPASAVVPWPITTQRGTSSASITAYSDSPSRSGVTTSVSMPSASTRSRHAPMASTRAPRIGGVAELLDLGAVQGRLRVSGAGEGDDDHPPPGALGDGRQAAVPGRHAQVDAGLQHGAQVGRARRLHGDHEDLQGAARLGDHEPAGVLGDDQHLDVVGAGDGLERRPGRARPACWCTPPAPAARATATTSGRSSCRSHPWQAGQVTGAGARCRRTRRRGRRTGRRPRSGSACPRPDARRRRRPPARNTRC